MQNALKNLKTILKTKRVEIDSNAFKLLLFERKDFEEDDGEASKERVQIIGGEGDELVPEEVVMSKQKTVITLEQLQASIDNPVDNTGNVREWPSEEILAYYLSQRGIDRADSDYTTKFRVIELGAGKSGLVGLAVASLLKR